MSLVDDDDRFPEEPTDEELLELIARRARMMRALSIIQGAEVNIAYSRGIDEELIMSARRTVPNKSDEARRKDNLKRHQRREAEAI
jgi:hypothetical protein